MTKLNRASKERIRLKVKKNLDDSEAKPGGGKRGIDLICVWYTWGDV